MGRPKEFDRDDALQSAIDTFRRKGFGATSTEDLRLAMGIGRQSFYDTFTGKRAVYLEALRRYNADRVASYVEAARKATSAPDALEAILVTVARSSVESAGACLGVSSICEFGTDDAEVTALNETARALLDALLEQLVREGQAAKTLRRSLDPKVVAQYLQSTMTGLRISARGGASATALRTVAALAMDALKVP